MKRLVGLVVLLAIALGGAWLWRVVAADPGMVMVAIRGYSIETTLPVAMAALAVIMAGLWLLLVILRYPLRYWRRRRRHVARERLAGGLVALHEGRWRRAENLLERAASESQHRLPALMGAARAAQARGDEAAASALLAKAAERHDAVTVALVAAREHQRRGEYAEITALFDHHPVVALPPRALDLYLAALVETGRAREALSLIPALHTSHIAEGDALLRKEANIIAAALTQTNDIAALNSIWAGLSRSQKWDAHIVAAYARRTMALGDVDAGVFAVEKALTKQWDTELVAVYGELPRGNDHSPLKMAENWLVQHPQDPVLLLTLGRLCRHQQLWGKAEDYLQRALAAGAGAAAWEELGHVHAAQHHDVKAREAFAQALASLRGVCVSSAPQRTKRELIAVEAVAEQRSSMGVPLLSYDGEASSSPRDH